MEDQVAQDSKQKRGNALRNLDYIMHQVPCKYLVITRKSKLKHWKKMIWLFLIYHAHINNHVYGKTHFLNYFLEGYAFQGRATLLEDYLLKYILMQKKLEYLDESHESVHNLVCNL